MTTHAAQQVGAGRRQQVVAGQLTLGDELIDATQAFVEPFGHPHGHGLVEGHHGRGHESTELAIERGDLRPVGARRTRRLGVDGGDGRLELVRPWRPPAQRPLDERHALLDGDAVPEVAILVLQHHEVAIDVLARRASGIVQHEQGQETEDLRLVRHQLDEHPRDAHGLLAQIASYQRLAARGRVALVVDEVQHGQHASETVGELVIRRHAVGDARQLDLALGPHEALGHRGLGHHEGPGDLRCRQSTEGAQRERHPAVDRQGRVAAREHETQTVVGDGFHIVLPLEVRRRVRWGRRADGGSLLVGPPTLAAQPIERSVARGGGDPRPRTVRHPFRRPAGERNLERVLHRVFGEVPVVVAGDEGRDDPTRLAAEDVRRELVVVGRTAGPLSHPSP